MKTRGREGEGGRLPRAQEEGAEFGSLVKLKPRAFGEGWVTALAALNARPRPRGVMCLTPVTLVPGSPCQEPLTRVGVVLQGHHVLRPLPEPLQKGDH